MITIWLLGLPSAGKTTISRELCAKLASMGYKVELLDGDEVRRNLGGGYLYEDRYAQIKRLRYFCKILNKHGIVPIVAAITPYELWRVENRKEIEHYLEVYVDAPLELCKKRDVKGLYKRALDGEIKNMTGVDDPFEEAYNSDVICYTENEDVRQSVNKIYNKFVEVMKNAVYRARDKK